MPRLIETAEQHVALQLGNLTAQNIALSCALEQRDRALGDAQQRVTELEKELADLKSPPLPPEVLAEQAQRAAEQQMEDAAEMAARRASAAPDRAEGGIA